MDSGAKARQRVVQTLKLSFIVAGALFVFVVYRVPSKSQQPANSNMELVTTLIALSDVGMGFLAPQFLVKAGRGSSRAGTPATPVQQWLTRCVFSLALFQSCNLFAMVLHFVGARVHLVELLFGVGMVSMILWSPGAPPDAEGGTEAG